MGLDVQLLRIAPSLWDDPYVFKLSKLVGELQANIPAAATQHIKGAYLCLHSVPSEAIVEVLDRGQIEDRVESREYRESYLPYDSEDSDDEATGNNLNDDMIKMMEN